MFTKPIHYSAILFLFSFLGCGEPTPPMPSAETYRNSNNQVQPPQLSQEWENKLKLVYNEPGLEDFKANLMELTEENRAIILEVLNNMGNKDHEIRFLQDFVNFNKIQQSHLINIFLYLEKQNKDLLKKAVRCYKCTNIFEKYKLSKMFDSLEHNCQDLIMEFVEKLQED
jgi:DNA-binding MarR family transcriptional regulator